MTLEKINKDYELVLKASKLATGANVHDVNCMIHNYYGAMSACNFFAETKNPKKYALARECFEECKQKLVDLVA